MTRKIGKRGRFIMVFVIASLVSPVISIGASNKDLGRDWYCSEPEEHTQAYEKHLKMHIDSSAEAIANELQKIFCNQSLTADEKREKTVKVLNQYLSHIKAGMGD